MPHATFEMAAAVAADTADIDTRQIVPGVEPGGSRAGQPTKPALLILDAWVEVIDYAMQANTDFNIFTAYLKLSQEQNMDPGFLIPVAQIGQETIIHDATGAVGVGIGAGVRDIFHEHGSIWAPAYVSFALFEQGVANIRATLHLEYEVIEIPWVEWFIKWEFLDNITNNAEAH
ncbi:MAG: hypothetical protein V3U45_07980 [bacterium]